MFLHVIRVSYVEASNWKWSLTMAWSKKWT